MGEMQPGRVIHLALIILYAPVYRITIPLQVAVFPSNIICILLFSVASRSLWESLQTLVESFVPEGT